jgi:hypothetical protein
MKVGKLYPISCIYYLYCNLILGMSNIILFNGTWIKLNLTEPQVKNKNLQHKQWQCQTKYCSSVASTNTSHLGGTKFTAHPQIQHTKLLIFLWLFSVLPNNVLFSTSNEPRLLHSIPFPVNYSSIILSIHATQHELLKPLIHHKYIYNNK